MEMYRDVRLDHRMAEQLKIAARAWATSNFTQVKFYPLGDISVRSSGVTLISRDLTRDLTRGAR